VTAATVTGLAKRFSFLQQGLALLGKGLGTIAAAAYAAYAALKSFFGEEDTGPTKENTEELKKQEETLREVTAAYQKKVEAIRAGAGEFARNIEQIGQQIALETQLIGRSKEYTDLLRAQNDLTARTATEVEKLRKAKELLTKEEQDSGLGAVYDEQILKVRELAEAEQQRIQVLVAGLNEAERANQMRLFGIQEEYRLTDALRSLENERANLGLSEIEKKYKDITRAADDSARAAIRAEEARRASPLSEAEAQKYYDRAREGVDQLRRAQEQLYEESRRFSTGWNGAFRKFSDDAFNAAKQAENIFNRLTSSLEDLFVDFAKTGRLNFRSLINGIVEDLLRSQIRQLIAQTFGMMGGGGGGGKKSGGLLGGFLIPGFLADGGPALANKPYIVGERGPELFVPNTTGTVVPNNAMGGGMTSITYNINAVDAPSFQALVARDPQFIYSVSEMGRRTIPGARA
jgi:lambda family phage tail tape measure protein